MCKVCPYNFLDFLGVCCHVPHISDFINLNIHSPSMRATARKDLDLCEWEGRDDLDGGGEGITIRIHCRKKNLFSRKNKEILGAKTM